MDIWQEIHGFSSIGEYHRFFQLIDCGLADGRIEEIAIDQNYGKGEIYGGRWFRDVKTGAIWRLVAPDFPFRGLWEPVSL